MILKGSTHRVRVHVTRARLSGFWRRVCTYCTVLSSPYTPAAGNAGALKKSLSSKRRSPVTVSYVQYTCTPSTRPQTPAAARAAPIRHPTPRPPSRPVEGSSKPPEPHPVLADDEIRQKASGTTHRCQLGHVSSRMVNPLRSRQLSRSSWDGASRRHALAVPSRAGLHSRRCPLLLRAASRPCPFQNKWRTDKRIARPRSGCHLSPP
mmetsp:Transcript_46508/g.129626  ORF Transcript_46508/g.129626 Transcript_46508/m.129626 type:complete len:207 (-) Transcript_46508:57-677(-)